MLHSLIDAARARVHNARSGFTLIELLVVIVLLGILMAIAVPTFQNAQERGQAASAQSELKTAYDIASGEFAFQADGNFPSTTSLVTSLNASEDEILFAAWATPLTNAQLFEVETAIDAYVASGTALGQTALADDVTAPPAGTVGVQVFDRSSAALSSGTNPDYTDATTEGNALIMARQDVSRNNVVWWLVSNKDEDLADNKTGAFFGSTRDGFDWRQNDTN